MGLRTHRSTGPLYNDEIGFTDDVVALPNGLRRLPNRLGKLANGRRRRAFRSFETPLPTFKSTS